MSKLGDWVTSTVAAVGENGYLVSWNAHAFFGWFLVSLGTAKPWWFGSAIGLTIVAAVKEFWFDATYEVNPKQTAFDNWTDFAGYVVGAWAAVLFFLHRATA